MAHEADKKLENGAGKFTIDIPGCGVASANIQSITIEDLVIDERETTSGMNWDYRVYAPGDAHYGSITIQCKVGKNSKELYNWWHECSIGNGVRKNITVHALDRAKKPARSWNIFDAFPTRWDSSELSPSSNTSVETLVCKMGRVELAT
jgi:phage tail-like protein